jgi:hypothetical protein
MTRSQCGGSIHHLRSTSAAVAPASAFTNPSRLNGGEGEEEDDDNSNIDVAVVNVENDVEREIAKGQSSSSSSSSSSSIDDADASANAVAAPKIPRILRYTLPAIGIWLCSSVLSMIDTATPNERDRDDCREPADGRGWEGNARHRRKRGRRRRPSPAGVNNAARSAGRSPPADDEYYDKWSAFRLDFFSSSFFCVSMRR